MTIYKDIIGLSHDDLLTDEGFDIDVGENGITFEIKTKIITKDLVINNNNNNSNNIDSNNNIEENEFNDNNNVQAAGTYQINNLVEVLKLVETSFDKKSYLNYFKKYMKDLILHLKQSNNLERAEIFQRGAQSFIKTMMDGENFKKFQFFSGPSNDVNGQVVLCYHKDSEPHTSIFIMFFDGLQSHYT